MGIAKKADGLRNKVQETKRGEDLAQALIDQLDAVHSLNYFPIPSVEQLLLEQKKHEVEKLGVRPDYPRDLPKFSPSSAGKCSRELVHKILKIRRQEQLTPQQKRWTRNSTSVHDAVQQSLLESEVMLDNPRFTVERTDKGLPAWEKNVEDYKILQWKGQEMVLFGMMDGILIDNETGKRIGFEFKTKSTTMAKFKHGVKSIQPSHAKQCWSYSLLFDVDEFIVMYETVAKDDWKKGEDARPDLKAFHLKVSEGDKKDLLDRFAHVSELVENGEAGRCDAGMCFYCTEEEKAND